MGKIKQITIDDFSGGISKDLRTTDTRKFALAKNFDVSTYRKKIEPQLDVTDRTTNTSYAIVKFLASPITLGGVANPILGLAKSGAFCAVYHWNGSTWDTDITNDTSSSGTRNENVFFYYKEGVFMFGGNNLKRFDANGVASFDDDFVSTKGGSALPSITSVAQPVHHLKDDNAYFFVNNIVYRLDNTTWDGAVLTLPDSIKITGATAFGNYLAISCSDKQSLNQKSYVYLWDRDSSLATVDEMVQYGSGEIMYIANLNNKLFSVMEVTSEKDYKIVVKQLSGDFAVDIDEIISDSTTGLDTNNRTSQVVDNKLYFPAGATKDGNTRYGIWELRSNGRLNLFLSTSSITDIRGIFNSSNNWWIAHDPSGTVTVTVEKVSPTYIDAEYETLIIGDALKNHTLNSIAVSTEPLTSTGEIVVEYKLNSKNPDGSFTSQLSADSWTEIFTEDTLRSVYHQATNIESDGSLFPDFTEIQFKVTSKNGAKITGIEIIYEEKEDSLN